eukprot:COSAG05_NODE_750_length_7545_cov_22.231265_3_plen_78_part_00
MDEAWRGLQYDYAAAGDDNARLQLRGNGSSGGAGGAAEEVASLAHILVAAQWDSALDGSAYARTTLRPTLLSLWWRS